MIAGKGGIAALAAGLVACFLTFGGGALAGSTCGLASWYGLGGQTASGEYIVPGALTAAHRTLPFGTRVRVENLDNGESVVVRINDRGPFIPGREIDVTRAAAEKLDFIRAGVANVRLTVLDGKGTRLGHLCADANGRIAPVIEASAVPMPRTRPMVTFAARFGYAFAPTAATPGAENVQRVLAAMMHGDASATAFAAATPRAYPEGFFAADLTYAYQTIEPPAASAERAPAMQAASVLNNLFAWAE